MNSLLWTLLNLIENCIFMFTGHTTKFGVEQLEFKIATEVNYILVSGSCSYQWLFSRFVLFSFPLKKKEKKKKKTQSHWLLPGPCSNCSLGKSWTVSQYTSTAKPMKSITSEKILLSSDCCGVIRWAKVSSFEPIHTTIQSDPTSRHCCKNLGGSAVSQHSIRGDWTQWHCLHLGT